VLKGDTRIILKRDIELIPVRSGLCTSSQLGGFITSLPTDIHLNDTSIYTTPLKFTEGSFPISTPSAEDQPVSTPEAEPISTPEEESEILEEGEILDNMERSSTADNKKRQWDIIESITNGVMGGSSSSSDEIEGSASGDLNSANEESGERQDEGSGGAVYEVPTYSGAVHYKVPKTGYYCVGTFHLFISLLRLIYRIISTPLYHYSPSERKDGMKLTYRNRTCHIIKSTNDQL